MHVMFECCVQRNLFLTDVTFEHPVVPEASLPGTYVLPAVTEHHSLISLYMYSNQLRLICFVCVHSLAPAYHTTITSKSQKYCLPVRCIVVNIEQTMLSFASIG